MRPARLRSLANARQGAVVRVTSPVAKLIPKNGCTMKRDPRVLASASDALQAAGSKGWGMRTWPEVARSPAASRAALNSVTVRPTKPACSTRV